MAVSANGRPSPGKIAGVASVYDVAYSIGMCDELIAVGAFRDVLSTPLCREMMALLVGHDTTKLLARAKAGTLEVYDTSDGLAMEAALPDTDLGREVFELVERGDLSQMSMRFAAGEVEWREGVSGTPLRVVKTVASVVEVSVVTWPASSATSVWIDGSSSRSAFVEPDAQRSRRLHFRRLDTRSADQRYGRRITCPDRLRHLAETRREIVWPVAPVPATASAHRPARRF